MKSMLIDLLKTDIQMFSVARPQPPGLETVPRVFKEHLPLHLLPDKIKECKVIYLVRNPKDVVVSLQHHMTLFKMDDYDGDLNKIVQIFCSGKFRFRNVLSRTCCQQS